MVRKGVFKITNKKTGRVYIASSATNLDERIYNYWEKLKEGTFHNAELQTDFNKYGSSNFGMQVIDDHCSSEEEVLEKRERELKKYGKNIYNNGKEAMVDFNNQKMKSMINIHYDNGKIDLNVENDSIVLDKKIFS